MKRKLKVKKQVVVGTLKPKQLENITGGKKGSGSGSGGVDQQSCSRICSGW